MNSADQVDKLVEQLKAEGVPLSEAIFRTGVACVGWPYTYGARGGKTTKDGVTVRTFDCRGFTYWCALQFGIRINGAGCTSQWNDESNWAAKGEIDTIPDDVLVCLFYKEKDDPKKMAHTGFGLHGETVECSSGVQYFAQRKKKWTHWAIPQGVAEVDPDYRPTLRRGDKGPYVTLMQTELLQRGYALPKYGADGDFGGETEKAVKQFQTDWGLAADGVCGPKTWAMLESTPVKVMYTVTVPHLSLAEADRIIASYPDAVKRKEGD